MEVNTAGFKGHIRESAKVQLNDPERSSILLSLEAEVRPVFNITPNRRFFLITNVGRPVSQKLRLEVAIDQPVRITHIDHSFGDDLDVDLRETEKGRIFQLTLSTKAKRPVRKVDQVILHLENGPVEKYPLNGLLMIGPAKK